MQTFDGELDAAQASLEQCLALAPGHAPAQMQQLIAALRHNPTQADRFIGTIAGTVPVAEFFAPENLVRITGMAIPGVAA